MRVLFAIVALAILSNSAPAQVDAVSSDTSSAELLSLQRELESLEETQDGLRDTISVVRSVSTGEANLGLEKYIDDLNMLKDQIVLLSNTSSQDENFRNIADQVISIYLVIDHDFGAPPINSINIKARDTNGNEISFSTMEEFRNRYEWISSVTGVTDVSGIDRKIEVLSDINVSNDENKSCLTLVAAIVDDIISVSNQVSNCVDNYDSIIRSAENIISVKNEIIGAVDDFKEDIVNRLNASLGDVGAQISAADEAVDDIIREQLEGEAEIEKGIPPSAERVIYYTLIAWASIIVVVVVAIIVLSMIKRNGNDPTKAQHGAGGLSYALFLDMMTVFVLTAAILVLGLGQKIEQEGLAALIGGISGYVLGRMKTNQERPAGG